MSMSPVLLCSCVVMAYAYPTPTSRGLTIHGSLVDTSQFSNRPSTGSTSGLSISQPDITEISVPSPTVYQSSPLRARSPASIAGIPLLSPLINSKSAASGKQQYNRTSSGVGKGEPVAPPIFTEGAWPPWSDNIIYHNIMMYKHS